MSGAGKASALKTFEDLGYYCVDNLPVGLISNFADLVLDSLEIQRAALVVDIREGARLDKFLAPCGDCSRPRWSSSKPTAMRWFGVIARRGVLTRWDATPP